MSFLIRVVEDQPTTITAQYQDKDGDPIDLTGWTLSFRVGTERERSLIEVPVTITDAVQGEMQIDLSAANTNLPRRIYICEIARTAPTLGTIVQGRLEVVLSLFGE